MIIHSFAVAVPLVVAPLGLRLRGRPGALLVTLVVAGVAAAGSLALDRGVLAAAAVLPFAIAAVWATWAEARSRPMLIVPVVATSYLAISAASLLLSRAGFTFGRVHEPIVELTAVHYGFAGFGAGLLAWAASSSVAGTRRRTRRVALVATASAPPVIALGFLSGNALPQVGGAALLTAGVWSTAWLTATTAFSSERSSNATAVLLLASAVAPVAPMVLAVCWAAAQHWAVPALDIPAMARVHGAANALGFVACGLVGYRRLLTDRRRAAVEAC